MKIFSDFFSLKEKMQTEAETLDKRIYQAALVIIVVLGAIAISPICLPAVLGGFILEKSVKMTPQQVQKQYRTAINYFNTFNMLEKAALGVSTLLFATYLSPILSCALAGGTIGIYLSKSLK